MGINKKPTKKVSGKGGKVTKRVTGKVTRKVTVRRVKITWRVYRNTYLEGYASGKHSYKEKRDALTQCYRRKDCGGVTYEPKTRNYTLRKGTKLKKSSSKEISYIKHSVSTSTKSHGGKG